MIDLDKDANPSACRVLLVEDEVPAALELESVLRRAGVQAIFCASSLAQAEKILEGEEVPPDVAVLDINIGGELVYPLAERLQQAGSAIVFVTGYSDTNQISNALDSHPRLEKPFSENDLLQAIQSALKKLPHFS